MNQPNKHPTKKGHHRISKFYLRGFTAPGPAGPETVWTYDKKGGEPRPSLVENTAIETHLYSITDDSGERLTDAEDLISSIESNAAAPLRDLLTQGTLNGPDRAKFASFLAMTYVRTDAFRRIMAEGFISLFQTKNFVLA